jgi:hypothetical protein
VTLGVAATFAVVRGSSGSPDVVRTLATAAAPSPATSSTTSTTLARPADTCLPPSKFPTVSIGHPTSLTVTSADRFTTYVVPIGTVFVVHLSSGGCVGPYFPSAPTFGPQSIVQRVPGTAMTLGAQASATFKVVGLGQASIRFEASCPPSVTSCLGGHWVVQIVASSPTTSTIALPRTS